MANKNNKKPKALLSSVKKLRRRAVMKRWGNVPEEDHLNLDNRQDRAEDVQNSPEIDLDVEATTESNQKKFILEGRRIVDISHFWKQLQTFQHMPYFNCNISNCNIVDEKRKGLLSSICIKCNMCGASSAIDTDKNDSYMNTNVASVLGTISIGCGYSQLDQLLSIMNIPSLGQVQYTKCHENMEQVIEDALMQQLKLAGEEEAKIALENGNVDKNGNPCITVIADGAWSKRSYKMNYNALSGVAVIIGEATKKILFVGIKNKFCMLCSRYEGKGEISPVHSCSKNWKGTSTSMESAIIVEGFKQSLATHGLVYSKLVGDGDSSVSKKLLEEKPYGAALVEKVECVNHLLRNLCYKLKSLSQTARSSLMKVVPIKLRKKLENSILKFRSGIKKAAAYRANLDVPHYQQITYFRNDVINCVDHIFGCHKNCDAYFCKGNKDDEENLIAEITECGLKQDILNCLQRIALNASSLLLNKNNNAAELFNSIVNKMIGGKRVNFSLKMSYKARCQLAALSYNCKEEYIEAIMDRVKYPTGTFTKQYIYKRTMARKRCYLQRKKQFKRIKATADADEDYGDIADEISDEELQKRKEDLQKMLQKTDEDINQIEVNTRGQSINPFWHEQRAYRITASHFGSICKMRASTKPDATIKALLHNKFVGNKATQYGQQNESTAIQKFEEATDLVVNSCGIFIGRSDEYYLGASPDGIIETENAIIEVKCPANLKDISLQQGVADKKINFLKYTDNDRLTLKRNHNYFYQIQGQLHITGRSFCYFVVWTPVGNMFIEKIEKDDHFWQENMKTQLSKFFFTALMPEIIKKPIM